MGLLRAGDIVEYGDDALVRVLCEHMLGCIEQLVERVL